MAKRKTKIERPIEEPKVELSNDSDEIIEEPKVELSNDSDEMPKVVKKRRDLSEVVIPRTLRRL